MDLSTAERLLYTTVKLNRFREGNLIGSGTGFFYNVRLEGSTSVPVIVTNKHVVAGADRVEALCHQAVPNELKPSGKYFNLQMNIGSGGVPSHPNPDVDLCVLPIGDLINQAAAASTPIVFINVDSSLIPNADDWDYFDAMEEVVMIGCPRGIYDDFNKMPLARRGITATPIAKFCGGMPYFMVDMACFPGSSGSPIFLFNQNGYLDRKTNTNRIGAFRLLFVGVLFGGPQITNTGNIILTNIPTVAVSSMMHLGQAVRSSELLEIEQMIRDEHSILPPK